MPVRHVALFSYNFVACPVSRFCQHDRDMLYGPIFTKVGA